MSLCLHGKVPVTCQFKACRKGARRRFAFTIIALCRCGCDCPVSVYHVLLSHANRCEKWVERHAKKEDRPIEFITAFPGHLKEVP